MEEKIKGSKVHFNKGWSEANWNYERSSVKKTNEHTNKQKQAEVNGVVNYKAGIDIAAGEQNDSDAGGKALCSTAEALQ